MKAAGTHITAPPLSVRGIGPGEVTIGGLTAGGAALLVFVNEDCPTSALAMRNLGPLCPAWEEAGLTATAVFEDPLEVAIRVARRLGWTGRVVSQDPPYETSRAYGLVSVPTAVLVDRAGTIAGTVDRLGSPALAALIGQAGAILGAALAAPRAAEPLLQAGLLIQGRHRPGARGGDGRPRRRRRAWRRCSSAAGPTACRSCRRPPSGSRRCSAAATGASRSASSRPAMGEATLERVAACAVLAGCRPAYFPVVVGRRAGGARSRVQPARPGGDHPARRAARGGERPGPARRSA